MSIRIVNLKSFRLKENEVLVRVDRQSVLGNVFKMREDSAEERDRVCDAYADYFNRKVKEQGRFRNEVIRIYRMARDGKDIALGCWCYPKRCHAEVIKTFIESYLSEESEGSSSNSEVMQFRGKYWFLSNFYPCEVGFGGLTFSCVESAFQAMKCANAEDRKQFVNLNGAEAKRLGRKIKMRKDWHSVRDDVMFALVSQKFEDPELMEQLQKMSIDIVENNTWNDTYWGVCNGKGQNKLGKILMQIRDSYNVNKKASK